MRRAHAMPFGAEVEAGGGVRFAIWAPGARSAVLHVDGRTAPMERSLDGFFRCLDARAAAGSRYAFSFDGADLLVPDPASRFNPEDVHAASEVIDPAAFEWPDDHWGGRPWREAVIYELHVGTFTPEGTYRAAQERLDHLVELGVTAIELMPLADTPGKYNWGYDGVLQFAPESGFGRPEDLKAFVAAAHLRGLMVLLDVVYNHFGPDGNYLHVYAPQFFTARHHTPWGKGINFDGTHSDVVRDFFVHNALYWLEEYRFDGLRLDAVHSILDDSRPNFLTELAQRVASLGSDPPKHLVLENDHNTASYLRRDSTDKPTAYAAQWNDDFHHTLHVLLTGERRGHYQDYQHPASQLLRALREGFVYQGEVSSYRGGKPRGESAAGLPVEAFVSFLQNHDQIGNRPDGKRLWMLLSPERMHAAETLLLLLPTPILLFMGDELHAPSRFPFFCDFHSELATAVTEGRRREFGKLSDAGSFDEVPPPNTADAHAAGVLDWDALRVPLHAAALERHRRLLALRRDVLMPRLPAASAGGELLGARALRAHWQLPGGARWTVTANLGEGPVAATPAPGATIAATAAVAANARTLPPWYVAWTLEA